MRLVFEGTSDLEEEICAWTSKRVLHASNAFCSPCAINSARNSSINFGLLSKPLLVDSQGVLANLSSSWIRTLPFKKNF